MKRYTGLIAAAHTPCREDGSLNLEVIEQQCELFVENAIAAVFPCGSTGESHSFTVAERKRVAERWVAVAKGKLPVIVHVGHNCQADSADLAAHAQAIGAVGIAAQAPSYFRPGTVDDLIDFMAPVAAAGSALPFYFYDIPSMTGVRLATDQFLAKAAARMPNLAGAKFTNDDLMMLQACLGLNNGAFELLFGTDENLLAGLALGAVGAIGSTYNYAAPVYHRIIRAFEKGDWTTARREQRKSVELVKVLNRFGGMRAGKAIMALIGVDCGPVRSPVRAVTKAEMMEMYRMLEGLDIFSRPLIAPRG